MRRNHWWALISLFLVGLASCTKPPPPPPIVALPTPTPVPVAATPPPIVWPTPVPVPTALPEAFVPRRSYDTAKLFNGLEIINHLQSVPGGIAPLERELDNSFSVDISLKVKVPAPMTSPEDFAKANPKLSEALPMLPALLAGAHVSPYYHYIYAQKVKSLQQDMRNLADILSRHNFFDCGTILELTNPATKRRALLLQADMDVVADGSDSDRFLEVDGTSMHYQPFTSYRWKKRTAVPSQFLEPKKANIVSAQKELAGPTLPPEREQTLRASIATNKLEIADLQTFSFLIAKADPFVVLPGFMLRDKSLPFCPRVGDYVAVIYNDKIYPAIFGDVGPNVKVGEASLRIATALNLKATAYLRPTNKLDVSYLIFPRSADPEAGPPDYEKWRTRCVELLADLGATNVNVERWENILPPLPTPTPMSTPDAALALPTPKSLENPVPSPTP